MRKRIGILNLLLVLGIAMPLVNAQVPESQAALQQGIQQNRIELPQWRFKPGLLNAITDVPGVKVGHVTILREHPHRTRTGVTAIVPHPGDLAGKGVWGNGAMLHGNGELTGLHFLNTTGILSSPILLTNSFAVGAVHTGVMQYYLKHYPGDKPGTTRWSGLLPIVGECYDGYFNHIEDLAAIQPTHAVKAIESATAGPLAQGRVGAGTGMRSFGMHAGIGSASRQVSYEGKRYTIGVLVNANHSRFEHLNPVIAEKLADALQKPLEELKQQAERDKVASAPTASQQRQGSIIVVIATDLPLIPHQLAQLAKRTALGIGATGSIMDPSSGDGVVVFSTAQLIDVSEDKPVTIPTIETLHPDMLADAYRATVEAVTEAQINALLFGNRSDGSGILP